MSEKTCLLLQLSSGETLHLSQQNWVLGRNGSQLSASAPTGEVYAIPLPQDVAVTLSKEHARIRYANGVVYVEDMHSANGVFLNGLPLRALQPVPLQSGDKLRLGALRLHISLMPCKEKHP